MFKKKSTIILLLFAAILALTACNAFLVGSGDLITETVQVSNFDSISLEGSGEVLVSQDGSKALEVKTYENVMDYVMVKVEDGTLKLGLIEGEKTYLPRRLIFHVSADDLNSLAVSGSGEITAETIDTDQIITAVAGSGRIRISNLTAAGVKASISGSGEIELSGGEANVQDISIGGSGKYLAGEVCSATVVVSIGGSGDATVCAIETLEADISGSGSVGYYGQPSVDVSTIGSGSINNLNK